MEAGVRIGIPFGRSLEAGALLRAWRNFTSEYFSPTVYPLLLNFVIDIEE